MATHGDIGLSQPAASTITMKLRSVTQDINSTVVHQEVMTIGGAESTLEVARVMATAPGSSEYGLVVRLADPVISSVGGAVNMRSSAANALVTVYQSTATDLRATVTPTVPTAWATVAQSTVGQTTATTIISSAATRPYVSALTVALGASTETGVTVGGFYEGSTLLWPVSIWPSGGVVSAQAAVAPPGFVFAGSVNRPISFNIIQGSTGTYHVGVTYRTE